MLILQVALGIVLAVLILAYLPTLLSLGFAAIALVVGLGVVAAVFYLLYQYWLIPASLIVSIGAIFLYERWFTRNPVHSTPEDVSDVTRKRSALGYETAISTELIEGKNNKTSSNNYADRERDR